MFYNSYNGITILIIPELVRGSEINLFTDSSRVGFGETFKSQWIQGTWPDRWTILNVALLEFHPIFLLLSMFAKDLAHSYVTLNCDNYAVAEIINKLSSKDSLIMTVVRNLVLLALKYNINLHAVYIPGKLNILPDLLSRFQDSPEVLEAYGIPQTRTVIPLHLKPGNFNLV